MKSLQYSRKFQLITILCLLTYAWIICVLYCSVDYIIKGAESYLFNFFSNFRRFWYHKKGHSFLIAHVKFHGWKVLPLEDNNEKVFGYGNVNLKWSLQSNYIGNCNIQNCLPNPNGLTNLIEILNLHLWCGDPSNEM